MTLCIKMKIGLSAFALTALFAGAGVAATAPKADRIFIGTIHTMDPKQPEAQAVAISQGRIIAVGTRHEITKFKSRETRVTRLGKASLLPGFYEAHAHFAVLAHTMQGADLLPEPQGKTRSIADIQQALRAQIPAGSGSASAPPLLMGWQYDDSLLAERRHPSRDDLDAVSRDIPIVILHISGHMVVVNSKALDMLGISAATPDPEGGRIRRRANSQEPDGLLEEKAAYAVQRLMPPQSVAQQNRAFAAVAEKLVRLGVTTATEHGASPYDLAALKAFADSGQLPIDLAVLVNMEFGEAALAQVSAKYNHGLRLAGAKLLLDGSLQGYTGWLTRPYYKEAPGRSADFSGYPAMSPARTQALVDGLFARNMLFAAHVNGDAAIESLLDAVAAARAKYPQATIQPIAIHAQTMREDQLDRAKALGITPSFFVDHVYFWGDRHRDIFLGPDRAPRISPAHSALRRSMVFTLHDDAPVTPPFPLRTVRSAVMRETVSGKLLGPDQRLNVTEALRAITLSAAIQHQEADEKGSITVGKRADLVVLGADPLRIDPRRLADIPVQETIKDGRTVYQAK